MKYILILLYLATFITSGVVMYQNSDKTVTDSFVIVEKNKEDVKFGYLKNKEYKTLQVSTEEFVKYEIDDTYKVTEYSRTFITATIIALLSWLLLPYFFWLAFIRGSKLTLT